MHLDLLPAVGAGDREGVRLHRRTTSKLRVGVPCAAPSEGNQLDDSRVAARANRVLLEVEDECGGLPGEAGENELVASFEQRGADRSGLGIGLTLSRPESPLGSHISQTRTEHRNEFVESVLIVGLRFSEPDTAGLSGPLRPVRLLRNLRCPWAGDPGTWLA